jgi:thermitase
MAVDIRVEGFDLKVRGGAPEARAVADAYLGGSWHVIAGVAEADQFDVMAEGEAEVPDVGRAWEIARRMSEDPRVVHAEPLLVTPGIEREEIDEEIALEGPPREIPARNWQIDHCSIHRAWELSKGEGIVIGHPDTGYMRHREIWSDDATKNRILDKEGFDFFKNDPDPLVPAGGSTHGTATASVIMSGSSEDGVHGVAPAAKLIPIRVDKDVVHFRWGRVRKAIEWATAKNVDVISMSLGGPIDGESLHQAVQRAVAKGIIVISAAGNVFPFVIYPAKYDEVLAIAATNVSRKKWGDSARGPAVDVCAPGEDVHRATFDKLGKETIEHSSGTSYATAVVAGIAALWLSFHGRAKLIQQYGAGNIAPLFRHIVMKHGIGDDPDWDTKHLGAGIIDAERVLRAPLPSPAELGPPADLEAMPVPTHLLDIAGYFPDTPLEQVRDGLLRLLNTTDLQLESDLERYGNELKLHIALDEGVRARITGDTEEMILEGVPASPALPISAGLAAMFGVR